VLEILHVSISTKISTKFQSKEKKPSHTFFFTGDLDRDGYNKMCGDLKCLPPCSDVKYDTSVSYMPYHVPGVFNFDGSHNSKLRSLG